jgi:hypothetical protein
MKMQVSEQGDEVFIELLGVAGRHQRILQALMGGPIAQSAGAPSLTAADVSVRAGADEMHIRLKGRAGHYFEALSVYRHLRHALVECNGDGACDADCASSGRPDSANDIPDRASVPCAIAA